MIERDATCKSIDRSLRSRDWQTFHSGSVISAALADFVPDLLCALNIENVQYGAVGSCLTGATRNGSRQQTFELFQVVDFCPNVIEMVRGDFADFTTSGFLRSTKPKQGADFVK